MALRRVHAHSIPKLLPVLSPWTAKWMTSNADTYVTQQNCLKISRVCNSCCPHGPLTYHLQVAMVVRSVSIATNGSICNKKSDNGVQWYLTHTCCSPSGR
eukprot:5999346-Amphidinium_carterae.1